MTGKLTGQVAIVTGAGRGLGRAYALALSAEGAGIVVNDRDKEPADRVVEEITAAGGKAVASYASVSESEGASRIVAAAVDYFGRVDIMVANAGADRRGPLLDLTSDDWDVTLKIHLFGSIYCSLEAARAMVRQGDGGVIINVTSGAFYLGAPTLGPYCVSKGGIYSLMRVLAVEFEPFGISVNALAPPLTATTPALAYLDTLSTLGVPQEQIEILRASAQLPEDVAPIVVFLATPEGRRLSGHVFTMSRDRLALIAPPVEEPSVHSRNGTWTLDELTAVVPTLVAGAPPS